MQPNMSTEEFLEQIKPLQGRLFRLAILLGRKPVEAEDIVQETLARLWEHRRQVEKPQAWCFQLVRRLAVDQWRRDRRFQTEEHLPPAGSPASTDPFEAFAQKEDKRQILHFVDQLPEKQQMIFQLRDLEGLSYQEIADQLSLPLNQVKVNLHRARTRIRTLLEKRHAYGNQIHS